MMNSIQLRMPGLLACLALLCLAAIPSLAMSPIDDELIRSYVSADGETSEDAIDARMTEVRQTVESIVRSRDDAPGYRRARSIHNRIQHRVFRHYNEEADSLEGLVEYGMYNCVSSTLFYGLVYRQMGYRPEILAFPGHLMVRIHIGDRAVDIETTSRDGFDVGWFAERWGRKLNRQQVDPLRARRRDPIARLQQTEGMYWQVPLEAAAGLARLNVAWDAIDRGDLERATAGAADAASFMTDIVRQTEGVQRLFERAHRTAFERGDFDLAYRIGIREWETFGSRTSTVDRLLVAGVKRIEDHCNRDMPGEAMHILQELMALPSIEESVDRLGRQVLPLIVASAARNGEWSVADRGVRLYADAELDPVESRRLSDWLEMRRDPR